MIFLFMRAIFLSFFYIFLTMPIFGSSSTDSLLIDDALLNQLLESESGIIRNSSDAAIKILHDKKDNAYIFKQIDDAESQFLLIRDLIASHIGNTCNIPVNKVWLITTQKKWPLKNI